MNTQNGDLPQIYVRTPLVESISLRPFAAGRRVFLKLENCQPSGSFKLRGVSAQVKHAKKQGYDKVVISSGGNAGLAAAYSAMLLEMSCHVVVPQRTPPMIINSLEQFGATVEISGDSAPEVADRALEISKLTPTALIYPSDHELLYKDHATMIDEIAEDLEGQVPSLILANCGGGGLVCGLVEGIRKHNWADQTKILVMETQGTHSFNACVKAGGERVILDKIESIATSLSVVQVNQKTADVFLESRPPLLSRLVTDKEAVSACVRFANDHRYLVGVACGATLAALYEGRVEKILNNDEEPYETIYDRMDHEDFRHNDDGPVVVIVCGGAEITLESLAEYRQQFDV